MKALNKVLLVNALSSGATGIQLLTLTDMVSGIFGADIKWPFIAVGIFLVAFALVVYYAFTLKDGNAGLIKVIIYTDLSWVLISAVIVLTGQFDLSSAGYLIIAAVAAWVGLMAYLQYSTLQQEVPNLAQSFEK